MMTYHNSTEVDNKWDKFKEKLTMMKDSVDPRFLIESLGFKITNETMKELRSSCIIHGGDNTTAFRFNKEKKTWVCFSHKCHELYGNDVISLIRSVIKCDFMTAVDYLNGLVGNVSDTGYYNFKERRERDLFISSYDHIKTKPYVVNEITLRCFGSMRTNYFVNKGIKKETLDYFEVGGGYVDNDGFIREVIPIRDDRGELIAYSLRDIRENISYDNKYILTPGFEKDTVLYNMNIAQAYGDHLPIIVVEGFKSVWRLYECGIKNVVAVIGSSLTEGQRSLLYLYALKGVVIMFDNDKAGIIGTTNAYKDLKDSLGVTPIYITETNEFGQGCGPDDLSDKQIHDYLNIYI